MIRTFQFGHILIDTETYFTVIRIIIVKSKHTGRIKIILVEFPYRRLLRYY